MDKHEAAEDLREFWDDYRTRTTQFCRLDIAVDWWKLSLKHRDLTGAIAASWARLGYLPAEAAPLIADGVTPQMAREMDKLATDIAGSPEGRAAQLIDHLVAEGVLVDPKRVRLEQDPDDPDHTIVHIDPEDR